MSLSRRRFLGSWPLMTGLLPGAALSGCGGADETEVTPAPGWQPPQDDWGAGASGPGSVFQHGVASGDPLADAVVLWTRVTAPAGATAPLEVEWRIALDPALSLLVQAGSATTGPEQDHTLHVDVGGLASGQTYYYQFRALGQASRRARTRTLPDGSVTRMRLGLVTCANYPAGYFHSYASLAQADLDVVLHLGDYLYEYQNGYLGDGTPLGRVPQPAGEALTLADYRARHAQYKTDPDLMELHRQHPVISVWDDHELANDSWQDGAQNHQSGEGEFPARKAAAERAYREWMPLRVQADPARIFRGFQCGDLLDLMMLDTRLFGRESQVSACDAARLQQAGRQLLGAEQEAWLLGELAASQARGTRWRLLGQQVLFAPLAPASGCWPSSDDWDGYAAARTRVLDAIEAGGIDNLVVFTGDAHSAWGNDVPRNPFDPDAYDPETGRGSLLVELVAPAVSSPAAGGPAERVLATHPHVKFNDQTRQGYVLVDITHERMQAEFYFVSSVREPMRSLVLGATLEARAGNPHLAPAALASAPRSDAPAPA